MKRTDPQFKLRLPEVLKEKLDAAADARSQTISNEIIRRLEWSFQAETEQAVNDSLMDRLDKLESQVQKLMKASGLPPESQGDQPIMDKFAVTTRKLMQKE